jgi:dCTP diphosphatase
MDSRSWPRDVQDRLRTFADERDWAQFHTPQNLLLATMGELGELAELYQWNADEPPPARVAEELADVLLYLLRFADIAGVDVEKAVAGKLAANADRYPAAEWRGRAGKATEPPRSEQDGNQH